MKKFFLCSWLLFFSFLLIAGSNNPSYALPTQDFCILGSVSGSSECYDGIPGTEHPLSSMNDYSYFGIADWEELSKKETPGNLEETVDIDLSVSPDSGESSGNYSFNSSVWAEYESIVIVLKDGGVGNDDIKWFAYLLNSGNSSGSWAYPTGKDLSYLSVLGSKIGTPIPEPATMLLLGLGLVGFVATSRRRFKK